MMLGSKIDIPHPKTKERPQQDRRRGEITIKSNPIPLGGLGKEVKELLGFVVQCLLK